MWTGLLEGTLDVAMGSCTAAQPVLQSDRGTLFAVHSKKVDALPNVKTLPEQGATSKFFTVSGFSGWALPKGTPRCISRNYRSGWRAPRRSAWSPSRRVLFLKP